MSATQELAQNVCHRYGWSYEFGKTSTTANDGEVSSSSSCWYVDVIVGFSDKRRFVSLEPSSSNEKVGRAAASRVALKELEQEIAKQEGKPKVESLSQVFSKHITVYESHNRETWDYFWKNKPVVVGIDAEGNQRAPPILVQIALDDFAILETPRDALSPDLQRLLADSSIIKVFCDNFSHADKKCLGLNVTTPSSSLSSKTVTPLFTTGPVIDLEALAATYLGPVLVPRGLSRMISLTMPELGVVIRKPPRKGNKRLASVGRFTLIEQGKAPRLRGLRDLSNEEQQYAALDAWCTLQAYKRLQQTVVVSDS